MDAYVIGTLLLRFENNIVILVEKPLQVAKTLLGKC